MKNPGDPPPAMPALDPAQVHEAVHQALRAHSVELKQWVQEAVVSHPELLAVEALDLHLPASVEAMLGRLVERALATGPLASLAAAPARGLALFQPDSGVPALPAAKAQFAAGQGTLTIPAELLSEPLQAYLERDPYALPALADREGYHGERHCDYWLSGLHDFLVLRANLARHGRRLAAPDAVLELGCASGRVLRHFLCQLEGLELWGTDLNERHVRWLLAHFPRALKAFQCTTLPTLPLADESLDLVTAFSVFTHIDEFELGWLLELRRLLRPGGIAYLTIHSEGTWGRTRPGNTLYELMNRPEVVLPGHVFGPELFQRPMPLDRVVFRWNTAQLNNTQVFVSRRHVHEVWGRFFDVLEIVDQGASYQDVVLLRKPG